MNKHESKYFNTALLMNEALLVLLEKKDYEFITVKEICVKAGVNRSTFYLHYDSINDLLVETIEMINKKFHQSFDLNNIGEETYFITTKYLIPYLEFVKNNKRIFRLVHEKPEIFNSKHVFSKMYETIFSPILSKYNVSEDKKEYIFTFYTQGVLSIVLKWLSNDCNDDLEKISNIITELVGREN